MWDKIMETDSGKEFVKWLDKIYEIELLDDKKSFAFVVCDGISRMIPKNIINNLAVEWLDSKSVNVYTLPDIDITKDRELIGFVSKILYNKKVIVLDREKTRQEAIAQGVKKAFELLEVV